MAVASHNLLLFLLARIGNDDFEEEAIELCLWQRIGALLLNRVLSGDDHEVLAQWIVSTINSNRPLVHGLQQCGLCFGWATVDLVGQKELGENRSFGQNKAVFLEVEKVRAN